MLPLKFEAFFISKLVPSSIKPSDAVNDAPVSLLIDVIVTVVKPPTVFCEILEAPVATNLKSPATTALVPLAILVTVSVSVLAIVITPPA